MQLARGPLLRAWRELPQAQVSPRSDRETSAEELSAEELSALWRSADLLISLGAPRAAVLKPLLRLDLSSHQALLWLRAAPEWAPLAELTQSPERELRRWREADWDPLKRGSVGVILEEQRLLYLGESGRGVRLVQEVVRVNNKRGVEELGEVALPVKASVLELYSLKPSGARRAPIMIPEKESYSLQDLQPGDVIVASYLEPLEPLRRAGGVLTPRLPTQDPQRAVWRRVYHVWRRGPQALELVWDQLAQLAGPQALEGAPSLAVTEGAWRGGQRVSVELMRASARPLEPHSLSGAEGPALQVSERRSVAREWGEVLVGLRPLVQLSEGELKALSAWAGGLSELGRRLWAQLSDERPLLSSLPALRALEERRGSRALALWSALSALGERCELWLASPPVERSLSRWGERISSSGIDPTIDPTIDLERFDHLLVACAAPVTPAQAAPGWELYDPEIDLSPRGVMSAALFGGEALSLWPPPRGERCEGLDEQPPRAWPLRAVALGWPEEAQERHELSLELWLDPDGARGLLGSRVIYGHAEHSLSGEEGALFYRRLARASQAERVRWLEGQWGRWLGAAELSALRFTWTEREGLALSYELKLSLRLPVSLKLSPQRWGERFGASAARRARLNIPPITQRVSVELIAGEPPSPRLSFKGSDLQMSLSPQDMSRGRRRLEGSFSRRVQRERAEMNWELNGALLAPESYRSWLSFAQGVDQAESALELQLDEEPR